MTPPTSSTQVRDVDMTPHVAQNDTRRGGSAIDAPHDATRRLRDESTCAAAHRAGVWVAQDDCRAAEGEAARPRRRSTALFVFASAAFNIRRIVTLRARAA